MVYTGDLKSNKLSVRVTDETLEFINSFPGDKLSEKFEAMIQTVKKEQPDQLASFAENLAELQECMDRLKGSMGFSHAPGEQFEGEQFLIKKMLRENGFKANKDLVARMQLLNAITERMNTLRDIKKAYKEYAYPYGYSEEVNQLIERIAKSLAYQERCMDMEVE